MNASCLRLLILSFSLFIFSSVFAQQPCSDPGAILSGASSTLDRNNDGYFSKYNGSGFTLSKNELTEFESLTGNGGADVPWTPLGGIDPNDDLQAGGGCGNTDIVTDTDGGSDYAYYSVVDPDGSADNGDEYLAIALRISDKVNGAFGFSFLMDSDNNCGSLDANAVCGNPCFEYEIQLSTSNAGGTVEVYEIDGCYGTNDCDTKAGGTAEICNPCNTEGIQVCADSSACGDGPVFWVYYVNFSQLPGVNSTSSFSLVPASNTSGNQIIYKSANVSDYGGLDDINDIANGPCDCTVKCSGSSCANCEQDCALSCAAEQTLINTPLPVNWLGIDGKIQGRGIYIQWTVGAEEGVRNYLVERKVGNVFEVIGSVDASPGSQRKTYSFVDKSPEGNVEIYRVKQIDFDGRYSYSPSIAMADIHPEANLYLDNLKQLHLDLPVEGSLLSMNIFSLSGQSVFEHNSNMVGDQLDIDLSHLSRGLYLVTLNLGTQGQLRQKIFVR